MKRKRGFIIALASAAATFGILFATIGKPPFAKHCHHGHHCHQTEMHNLHH